MSDGSPQKSAFGIAKRRFFIAHDCRHKTKVVFKCGGKEFCAACADKYMNEPMSDINEMEEGRCDE